MTDLHPIDDADDERPGDEIDERLAGAREYLDSPYQKPERSHSGELALGAGMWFVSIFIGWVAADQTHSDEIGWAAMAMALVFPGFYGRWRWGWTRYEMGVGLGVAITVGLILLGVGILFLICAINPPKW
jgi:hypothetical protein